MDESSYALAFFDRFEPGMLNPPDMPVNSMNARREIHGLIELEVLRGYH